MKDYKTNRHYEADRKGYFFAVNLINAQGYAFEQCLCSTWKEADEKAQELNKQFGY